MSVSGGEKGVINVLFRSGLHGLNDTVVNAATPCKLY